jgi:hypothetical protein
VASRTPRDVLLERLAGLITQRRPAQTLRVVIDNTDPVCPRVVKWPAHETP